MNNYIKFKIYREGHNQIYADDIPVFPISKKWGHLESKFSFILKRIEYLNTLLDSIYSDVYKYNDSNYRREFIDNKTTIRPYIEIMHLVNDLRMICDEIICLLYILEKQKINGDYPTKIKISCIGELLNEQKKKENSKLLYFKNYSSFLSTINEISNSYKHSFINSDIIFCRQLNGPIVFAGKNDYVNFNNERKLIKIPLVDIINEFNQMFIGYRELMSSYQRK